MIKISNAKTKLFICLAYYAGLRESEALQLRWTDIDYDSNCIWVNHNPSNGQRTKSRKTRQAVLTSDIKLSLEEWNMESPESEWIFPAPSNSGEHQKRIKFALDNAYRKAGIDPCGAPAHNLRHCFGTSLAENGCSAATIQVLMGHSDIRTSSRYLHPSFEAAITEFKNKSSTYKPPKFENHRFFAPELRVINGGLSGT